MIRPPKTFVSLLLRSFRDVLPHGKKVISRWRTMAEQIPDPELRTQALASLTAKRFHADGGSIYATATTAPATREKLIELIVTYQTISDYLDNLCDRSTSLDPDDFRQLHDSMLDSVTPGANVRDYYLYREEKQDGGYLAALVTTCQQIVATMPGYEVVAPHLLHLVQLYTDLQVHKHVRPEERVPRLTAWFAEHQASCPGLDWWEFAAASGSTLGVFMLFLAACDPQLDSAAAERIVDAYFPSICGLHILLDYFIDQEEDEIGGDLNFISYYPSPERAHERLEWFAKQSLRSIEALPHTSFHRMVIQGLIGMYLSDAKVLGNEQHHQFAAHLTRQMGGTATLFHYVSRYYRRKYTTV